MTRSADSKRQEELRQNLILALDMFDPGCELVLARIRRENPDLSEDEVEAKLLEWLRRRPLDVSG